MNLFQSGLYKSHSGLMLNGKIECDALSYEDLLCVARWIGQNIRFGVVEPVHNGGDPLANYLHVYADKSAPMVLIADDVLTTGASMEKAKERIEKKYPIAPVIGVVLFSRGICPDWVFPVFTMNQMFSSQNNHVVQPT